MREFYFYGVWEDSFAVLAAILNTGKATAFADRPHPEPKARFFERFTPEFQEVAKERGGFYLWLPGISSLPLEFGRWDSGIYAGKYYVSGGGPYLTLLLPGCYEEGSEGPRRPTGTGSVIKLGAGCLSCPHEIYVDNPGIVVKVPKAAQERDEEFRKIIKAHCKRYGPKKRYVGRNAIQLLEEGRAEVTSPGYYK